MLSLLLRSFLVVALLAGPALGPVLAQNSPGPLRITITEGVIEPIPVAIPDFVPQNGASSAVAQDISRVIAANLTNTGLFREIPASAHISRVTSFDSTVQYSDWKAINAQALITGAVTVQGDQLTVQFRLFDVFSDAPLGAGLQFVGTTQAWRRMAHKVSDAVYARITGESGYFDSRVVFVSETGPKDNRLKRLGIMDYDGANVSFLTGSDTIVLAPRFSPDGRRILYTSYETGFPRVYVMDVASLQRQVIGGGQTGDMSFAPRFSPNGQTVVYSLSSSGNTDIYTLDLASGQSRQLTSGPSIETAPSFSPDGTQIVFESDRSGSPQIYVMSASGGEARRVSQGAGRYGTPVWSPRGDLIAFTKQNAGRFHIGVMRTNGGEERLLTGAFLDEGPTWSPNGRVIMFTRESQGAQGAPALYSVDISGRNLQRVPTPSAGSDPAWGPLLP
jgi:TolB protein